MYVFDFKLYTFCWFAVAVSYGSCIWGNIVDKNIGYAYVLDKKDIEVNDRESDSDTYYGLKIKSKTESGSNVFVSGIDSLYVNHFEKN